MLQIHSFRTETDGTDFDPSEKEKSKKGEGTVYVLFTFCYILF